MADKLMYIPNEDTQNYPVCILQLVVETLGTQLNELINKNSIIVFKFIKATNKEILLKTLGTSVINSPMSFPSRRKATLQMILPVG